MNHNLNVTYVLKLMKIHLNHHLLQYDPIYNYSAYLVSSNNNTSDL